jgi:hypothetical protein
MKKTKTKQKQKIKLKAKRDCMANHDSQALWS